MKTNKFATNFFPFLAMTIVLDVVAFVLSLKFFITESTLHQLDLSKCSRDYFAKYLSENNYRIAFILVSISLLFHVLNAMIVLVKLMCKDQKP